MNPSSGVAGRLGPRSGSSPSGPSQIGPLGNASAGDSSGPSVPAVSLPSGGGSIRGMDESFTFNAAMGTGSWTIPLGTSACREGAAPSLSLGYSTGGGNGIFGQGWGLAGGESISRRTALHLPQYQDGEDSDIFQLSGTDDLVPMYKREKSPDGAFTKDGSGSFVLDESPQEWDGKSFTVRRYRPRTGGQLDRIERWTPVLDPDNMHWRVISASNELLIFGLDEHSQIMAIDPLTQRKRIFSWLLAEWYDSRGNARLYEFKPEDRVGVDLTQANEQHRTVGQVRSQLHLKRIKYGNHTPIRGILSAPGLPDSDWMFEVVFDFGDHNKNDPRPQPDQPWSCRDDPFSSYKAGFEIRTYRLVRRILMFHHFPDELGRQDYLVTSTELTYQEDPALSYLTAVQSAGYVVRSAGDPPPQAGEAGPYFVMYLPPLQFEYTATPTVERMKQMSAQEIDEGSMLNIPAGVQSQYQWLDLFGEGVASILAHDGGEWFYKQNLSPANVQPKPLGDLSSLTPAPPSYKSPKFGSLERIENKPSLPGISNSDLSFQDISGDGHLDMVVLQDSLKGFYGCPSKPPGSPTSGSNFWSPFQPFQSVPNIDFRDPNLRFLDLTGNGRADILITQDNLFVWYESLGETGFGPSTDIALAINEREGPRILFSDPTESIHLADFSGDGLIDIVRIRNGDVCYWPNLGYGQFGSQVIMDHAPMFDSDINFNPRRLILGDIDGSGTTDLIYFQGFQAILYPNLSGNAFSVEITLDTLMPLYDSLTSVTAVDLFGAGTMCLVWSSSSPSTEGQRSLQYIDLMDGVKPHLLTKVTNNLGKETQMTYSSSLTYYLQDEADGKPWVTRLPYPQHCIDKVLTIDRITSTESSQRFRYHHGNYDGVEREFRGFGMVEQWDSETLDLTETNGASNIHAETYVPPSHIKTWFHTGAFRDHEYLSRAFTREYFGANGLDEAALNNFFLNQLRDELGPDSQSWTDEELREASRALSGFPLRNEIYADDGTAQANLPYQVNDFGNSVRKIQPLGQHNSYAVFQVYVREHINLHYERQLSDPPTILHDLVLEVDAFGNALKTAKIAYGRKDPDTRLAAEDQLLQSEIQIMYSELLFTNEVDAINTESYHVPLVCRSQDYQLTGISPASISGRFSAPELVLKSQMDPIPFDHAIDDTQPQKRLLACVETKYRHDDLTGLCDFGKLESLALPGQSYSLCLTPSLLKNFELNNEPLLSDTASVLHDMAGFVDYKSDQSWWIPSDILFYHPLPGVSAEDELHQAQTSFFVPRRIMNAFGKNYLTDYDNHNVATVKVIDPLQNTVYSELDYRILKMNKMTDANGNQSAVVFDALGGVVGSAVMGKPGQAVGDTLEEFRANLSTTEMDAYFADPKATAKALLGNATARYVYQSDSYMRNSSQEPPRSSEIIRTTHFHDLSSNDASEQLEVSVSYVDGSGRVIQSKAQAEPDRANPNIPRWRCTGWSVLNNKGLVVQDFNPFFSITPNFEFNHRIGQSAIHIYDPMDRNIATINPDKSWVKNVYRPWQFESWDANDTVILNPNEDTDVKAFVAYLPTSDYLPTWHNSRMDRKPDDLERKAAVKTEAHANTPWISQLDAMGRPFLMVRQTSPTEGLSQRTVRDIEGKTLHVLDEKGRVAIRYSYDMLGQEISTESMDSGRRWHLADVNGAPVFGCDARGYSFWIERDELRRVTGIYCQNNVQNLPKRQLSKFVYGESVSDAQVHNLRGKLFQTFDQSGSSTKSEFDFKGNLLVEKRQLAKSYKSDLDWSKPETLTGLDQNIFISEISYDALDRVLSSKSPDQSIILYAFNEGGDLESIQCNSKGEKDSNNEPIFAPTFTNYTYDAFGKRIGVTSSSGAESTIDYDPLTRRVVRHKIVRGKTVVQDLNYTYDPVGNIAFVRNDADETVYFRNGPVDPESEFTYDAVYRLTEATGRENVDQTGGRPSGPGGVQTATPGQTGTGTAPVKYTENYTYDEAGNMTSLQHGLGDPRFPGWTRVFTYKEPSAVSGEVVNSNRLSSTNVGVNAENYAYDANGNMTSMPHLSQTQWDFFNRLQFVSRQNVTQGTPETTWYVYDSSGERVRKVTERQQSDPSGTGPRLLSERITLGQFDTYREYNGGSEITKECDTLTIDSATKRLIALVENWSGSAMKAPSKLIRFQIRDHFDSVGIELDDNGELISFEEFTPYGDTTAHSLWKDQPKRYRFSGKERDKESSLYYYGGRYHVPWLARWMSPDPLGINGGINPFEFALSNPVRYEDADGRCPTVRHFSASFIGRRDENKAIYNERIENRFEINLAHIPPEKDTRAQAIMEAIDWKLRGKVLVTEPRMHVVFTSGKPKPGPEPRRGRSRVRGGGGAGAADADDGDDGDDSDDDASGGTSSRSRSRSRLTSGQALSRARAAHRSARSRSPAPSASSSSSSSSGGSASSAGSSSRSRSRSRSLYRGPALSTRASSRSSSAGHSPDVMTTFEELLRGGENRAGMDDLWRVWLDANAHVFPQSPGQAANYTARELGAFRQEWDKALEYNLEYLGLPTYRELRGHFVDEKHGLSHEELAAKMYTKEMYQESRRRRGLSPFRG